MAYDILLHDGFSNRPAYRIQLYVRRDQTDVANNRSSYAWELRAQQVASGTTWSSTARPWNVNIGGQMFYGNTAPDFRYTNDIYMGSGTTGWFGHDGNGYLNITVGAYYDCSAELFGVADITPTWFYTDRNPRPPTAPSNIGISELGPTSFVYQFSGAGVDNGGSGITGWDAQIATNSAFTTGVQTVASSGTTTFSGLTPGTQYWVRSRGKNAYWNGAWSSSLQATTTSGAWVGRTGGVESFAAVPVYVGKDGAFVLAELRVGSGGSFVLPPA